MDTNRLKAPVIIAVLALSACSEAPKPSTEAAKTEPEKEAGPPQLVTAKTAYWQMYKLAHQWAADEAPLSMSMKEIPGIKNEDGKAAMWAGTFVSPSRKEARIFNYAITNSGDIRKGVSVGNPIPWGGPTHEARPFTSSDFAIDSDEAYKTAHAKAEDWLKKNPDKPLTSLTLGNATRFPAPVWYVLWGTNKLGFFQVINATTGKTLSGK